ncbi:MAG: hypothetical protein EXX96DRAFT_603562 [Benjaminiella poitrasii]|nr:MAG: hypothetical protein EXX96DRAFT_603562 [Benjaminiella poitrasii]
MLMSVLSIQYILSIKGIFYITVLAILIYFLRGYPQWKSQQCNNKQPSFKANVTDTNVRAQQTPNSIKTEKPISLANYIIVTPFAALYILGRISIDAVRYGLYYMLWTCERLMPYIDDWLFDFVTISIPQKYAKIGQWWIQQGKPSYIHYTALFKQNTLPSMIQWLESFFINVYNACCKIQSLVLQLKSIWRRIIDRHDWHQLMDDLCLITYNTCWIPAAWTMTRAVRLSTLIYTGIYAISISIIDEIKWICQVAVPITYNYLASTRLARFALQAFSISKWIFKAVYFNILASIVNRILTWFVKAIDKLIILFEQHTIHRKLAKIYRTIAPHLVWIALEFNHSLTDIKVYGVIRAWLIEQAPALSDALQKLYGIIIELYDWKALQQDLATSIAVLYNWIAEQSNLIFLSLERSLTAWANEQNKQKCNDIYPMKKNEFVQIN